MTGMQPTHLLPGLQMLDIQQVFEYARARFALLGSSNCAALRLHMLSISV